MFVPIGTSMLTFIRFTLRLSLSHNFKLDMHCIKSFDIKLYNIALQNTTIHHQTFTCIRESLLCVCVHTRACVHAIRWYKHTIPVSLSAFFYCWWLTHLI